MDLFLEDEGQQYGNMEEAASAARTPTCLEVWSGDHRQTPGGLKKSKNRNPRKKLTMRPLALRCQTQKSRLMIWGMWLCDTLTALKTPYRGNSENSWNKAPLPQILQLGSGLVQQRTGIRSHLSNSSWCEVSRVGHIQWHSVP